MAGSEAVTESQPLPSGAPAALATTPEEQIDKAFITVQSALRVELLQHHAEHAQLFEGVIIELLIKMGYGGSRPDAAAQLGGSGDGGG